MAAKKKAASKGKEVSFEKSLEALEAIVRRLDAEALGVEEAMAEYEKGLASLKRCRAILDAAEKKLEILVKEKDGKAETKPLDDPTDAGEDAAKPAAKRKSKKKSGEGEQDERKDGFLF
ncbi:MAG: exodeoxyribonuclease VII small subunit [Planctomycetota bacterium]|jgi:exodeoxyribonuclease VII small subunit